MAEKWSGPGLFKTFLEPFDFQGLGFVGFRV